ncbi:MAG TPA: aminotransferase class I/II-fold pyridoxal phosphate-dependent enzyme [Thermoanaerobaculia bacterium]|nr:aminotransferase class I/II-fold pyridoxal phosphate-dependent enzyme [Thermoanaerobaculia bacterium]
MTIAPPAGLEQGLSTLAQGLVGSEILKVSREVSALIDAGREVCNLTVGDFSPKEFRIPAALEREIVAALHRGETNYPPSDGVKEMRAAVVRFYDEELGLKFGLDSTLIACGARPVIFAAYAAVVDPGDKVIYPIPSWNNNHYTYLTRGVPVEITVGPETNFLPTAEQLRPHVRDARLICICTPLNPTGTVMARDEVEAIGRLVVEENARRAAAGERPLFLMWDQIYWQLTFGAFHHYAPPHLVPESAQWTIFVDGVSKAFAATGLRVGWAVAPPYVIARMRDILGHVGAWAPRPEQIAVARFLGMRDEVAAYHDSMIAGLRERLDLLHDGIEEMRRDGIPVRAIDPQGAIYLSAQFDLIGHAGMTTNEEIRKLLLERAGFAVVAFQAFGLKQETGWFRLSAGAVSPDDIRNGLARVRKALEAL